MLKLDKKTSSAAIFKENICFDLKGNILQKISIKFKSDTETSTNTPWLWALLKGYIWQLLFKKITCLVTKKVFFFVFCFFFNSDFRFQDTFSSNKKGNLEFPSNELTFKSLQF